MGMKVMRKIISIILFLLVANVSFGPTPVSATSINEDFECSWPPSGWINQGCPLSTTYYHSATHSVWFTADTHFLITPKLNDPETLSYWMISTGTASFSVEWSTSTTGGWTDVTGSPVSTDYSGSFKEESLNLSSYSNIYIRFSRNDLKEHWLDDVLVSEVTAEPDKFDSQFGSLYFPSGSNMDSATQINLWSGQNWTVDFLSDEGWKDGPTQNPSTRKVKPEDAFKISFEGGVPGDSSFFLAASLKMDSYYHDIYCREWNDETCSPGDDLFDSNAKVTMLAYNFPVWTIFKTGLTPAFPDLAGTTNPAFPGWEAFESDWILMRDQDLSGIGGGTSESVTIYQDHNAAGQWKYFLPLSLMGTEVGNELILSPGSPAMIIQYWYPDEPNPWTSFTMGDSVPYQSGGANVIKTYLKYE